MAWYKTGSVSVTSGQTTVTGIGTNFASNVRVGDGFKGPNGLWYEIVNVASQTVLGIFPAYAGPTVTANTNYMIAPLQGYNKESADRLRAITDSFPDLLDEKQDKSANLTSFSSLTGAADRIPYFTGVGALQLTALTAKARDLLASVNESQMRDSISAESTIPIQVATSQIDLNTLVTKRTDFYIDDGINIPAAGNGYLTVIPLVGGTECHQTYRLTGGVHGIGTYERAQYGGNWSAWNRVITAQSAILDPVLNTGGLMSTTTVNGFRVSKFANGQMCVQGQLALIDSVPANTYMEKTVTIPSGFSSSVFPFPNVTLAPYASNDNYGVTTCYMQSLTAVTFSVRNGSVAQSFGAYLIVWGEWK